MNLIDILITIVLFIGTIFLIILGIWLYRIYRRREPYYDLHGRDTMSFVYSYISIFFSGWLLINSIINFFEGIATKNYLYTVLPFLFLIFFYSCIKFFLHAFLDFEIKIPISQKIKNKFIPLISFFSYLCASLIVLGINIVFYISEASTSEIKVLIIILSILVLGIVIYLLYRIYEIIFNKVTYEVYYEVVNTTRRGKIYRCRIIRKPNREYELYYKKSIKNIEKG